MTRTKMVLNSASRQIGLACMAVLLLAGVCFGQLTVSLSAKIGPPTSKTLVSGSGFSPNAAIDIYFDTIDEALAIANSSGVFSKIAITVPASALPGLHWVSAVQRSGDTGAQAGFLVNTNWTEFGFTPNGDRFNPYENVLSPSTVGGIGALWNFTTGGAVTSSAAVVNGVVYVGSSDSFLYALEAATGTQLWNLSTPGPVTSSPAVAKGVVYVGYSQGIFAVDTSSGQGLWSYTTNSPVSSSPAVSNGVVYVTAQNGLFYALNASTGALEWSFDAFSTVPVVPALAGELVYFSCEGNNMCVDNATTGADAWFYSLSDVNGVFSSAAVSNGVVYAGASDGNVYALNALNGGVMWSYYTGSYYLGSPAVANGIVYVNSFNNTVYALNAKTGNLLWTYTTGSYIYSSPAVANGVVYISSNDDNVYALDAVYGNLLWSYATGGRVESSPAVANGVVFVGSNDNNVYAFGQANPPKSGQLSEPPGLKTLHPNLNLKPSQPVTNLPSGND